HPLRTAHALLAPRQGTTTVLPPPCRGCNPPYGPNELRHQAHPHRARATTARRVGQITDGLSFMLHDGPCQKSAIPPSRIVGTSPIPLPPFLRPRAPRLGARVPWHLRPSPLPPPRPMPPEL